MAMVALFFKNPTRGLYSAIKKSKVGAIHMTENNRIVYNEVVSYIEGANAQKKSLFFKSLKLMQMNFMCRLFNLKSHS